jgi:hypothetical protein
MCNKPLKNVSIYAHQARYEEGHLAADAPLERENLLRAVGVLVGKVGDEIEVRSSQPGQSAFRDRRVAMQRKGAALPKSGDNTFAAACGGDVAGDKRQQVSFGNYSGPQSAGDMLFRPMTHHPTREVERMALAGRARDRTHVRWWC